MFLAFQPAGADVGKERALYAWQAELAERTGVSQPAISQIENDVLAMDVAWMRAFARELECETADLLADEDNPDRLTEEERELIHSFRSASTDQRMMIQRVAEPLQEFRHANGNDDLKRAG